MDKNIYLIRHCEANGQSADALLTEKGIIQANKLSDFLSPLAIDRIIASPFLRAVQSIEPYAKKQNVEIELDHRLSERILSSISLTDWMEKLAETYRDMDVTYVGGESSKEAKKRIVKVIDEVVASDVENTILVTHGNILSLCLRNYDKNVGFEQWKRISNPDVFLMKISQNKFHYKRIWEE